MNEPVEYPVAPEEPMNPKRTALVLALTCVALGCVAAIARRGCRAEYPMTVSSGNETLETIATHQMVREMAGRFRIQQTARKIYEVQFYTGTNWIPAMTRTYKRLGEAQLAISIQLLEIKGRAEALDGWMPPTNATGSGWIVRFGQLPPLPDPTPNFPPPKPTIWWDGKRLFTNTVVPWVDNVIPLTPTNFPPEG